MVAADAAQQVVQAQAAQVAVVLQAAAPAESRCQAPYC
jgi:hypothetical protein